MKRLIAFVRAWSWWISIPLFVGLISFGPFFLLRCVMYPVAGEVCGRLFSVSQLVFDLHAYLEFMGEVFSDAGGIHLQFIGWMIRGMRWILPGASIVEMWLVLRWVFGVLTWWMLPWVLSFFMQRSLVQRRFAASVLWLSVFLPLGFRPGIFSWFMPFGLLALVACVRVKDFLQSQKILYAAVWTLLAIAVSVIYSWFFIFTAIWMGVFWGMWLLSKWRADALWSIVTALSLLCVWGLDRFASERISISFQTLLRNGMGFTHLIQISVMLVAAVLWLLLNALFLTSSENEKEQESKWLLFTAWVITIAGWCSSVATGIYLHNDHFRIFILLFAWMNACVLLTKDPIRLGLLWQRIIVWFIFVFSAGSVLRILIRPYAFDGDQLNIIHLFVWGALAVASFHVLGFTLGKIRPRIVLIAIFISACFIGGLPYFAMFQKEAYQLSGLRKYDQAMKWMQSSVPAEDTVCADPSISEDVAAFSSHSVFFTMQSIYPSGTDLDLYERLTSIASLTDVSVSSTKDAWTTWLISRGTACEQYSLYRKTIFSQMSQERFDRITGCPRDRMRAETTFIEGLSRAYGVPNVASRKVCKWLVFPVSSSLYWSLDGYVTAYQDSFIRIEQQNDK